MKRHSVFACIVCSLLCFLGVQSAFASPSSPDWLQLQNGWRMASANSVRGDGTLVSQPGFDDSRWYVIQRMPATVLQVLEDNGVYKNLYRGMNLTTPGDLWKQDWWYRTTFNAPAGRTVYSLIFKGINYRAEVWLNGHRVARSDQAAGMYGQFEFNVTEFIVPGGANVLAVRITPEQAILGENGVELADSWFDWINWKYIGYHDAKKKLDVSFVPDRNAGIWKRVYLSSTGPVAVRNAYVSTDLPLPATSPAALTVYCDLQNGTSEPVSGTLSGEISRPGKPAIAFQKAVTLLRDERKEVSFAPAEFAQLSVPDPDLWWPYIWGQPNLYHLTLSFKVANEVSDSEGVDFGIRKITQHRDTDNQFPEVGTGGNFYLKINGRDYLIRGGVYSPDLLYKNDPERDATIMRYAKDLGLNLIRWESKIADDSMLDRAEREGVPVMLGWMCCQQWEHWAEWSSEDQWVARASLRARIRELRSHASVVLWANGSDGLPPDPVLNDYNEILRELHWQNPAVDTVAAGNRKWSGIQMIGPYVWRPPYYWFSDKYPSARGSSAEEGDNETIPPIESLKKFIPPDKLWPINEYWFFHSGGNEGNNVLENVQRVLEKRYGPSHSVEEFSRKAQLAHYEDVRAHFESYATHWSNRKMTVNWMMNNPWPSLFGHLFDYYFKQGGGYFGAKKALRPLSVVWDYYATGDRSLAKLYVVNRTLEPREHLTVSVAYYNLDGSRKYSNEVKDFRVAASSSAEAIAIPRVAGITSTYFVRCELRDATGSLLAQNAYWASTTNDDLGDPRKELQFKTDLAQWADLSALNTMPRATVKTSATLSEANEEARATITMTNPTNRVAFFLRAEIAQGAGGDEILPITYDDNYVTLFPHETRTIVAAFRVPAPGARGLALRLEGYNVDKQTIPLEASSRATPSH